MPRGGWCWPTRCTTRSGFRPQAVIDLATLTGGDRHRARQPPGGAVRQRRRAAGPGAGGRGDGGRAGLADADRGAAPGATSTAPSPTCKQCATGPACLPDACHAAAFLREFAGPAPWAHLDIAGMDGARRGRCAGAARGQRLRRPAARPPRLAVFRALADGRYRLLPPHADAAGPGAAEAARPGAVDRRARRCCWPAARSGSRRWMPRSGSARTRTGCRMAPRPAATRRCSRSG